MNAKVPSAATEHGRASRRPSGAGRSGPTALEWAAAFACGLLLAGCTWQFGRPEPAPRSLAPGAFSSLDEAGVAQIKASRTIRLDMRSGRLEKTGVGLDAKRDYGPDIDTRRTGKLHLTISAPLGEVAADTDYVRFDTSASRTDFREVTYFLTASSLNEISSLIREGVRRYGIDGESAERWISSTEANPRTRSSFSIAPGRSTGLTVDYDVRYNGAKSAQVIIVHVTPVDGGQLAP